MCLHVFPKQNHIQAGRFPTSWEQFLRAIWGAVSLARVLSKTLKETQLTALKLCIFFS